MTISSSRALLFVGSIIYVAENLKLLRVTHVTETFASLSVLGRVTAVTDSTLKTNW